MNLTHHCHDYAGNKQILWLSGSGVLLQFLITQAVIKLLGLLIHPEYYPVPIIYFRDLYFVIERMENLWT